MHKTMRCNVLLVDYRGYGMSEGEPNEQGLMRDADVCAVQSAVDSRALLLLLLVGVSDAVMVMVPCPTRAGGCWSLLVAVVQAVMAWVAARPDVDKKKIVLFGRSLGGAVAFYAAEKHGHLVAAVIVENTFFNIAAMVDKVSAVRVVQWQCGERVGHCCACPAPAALLQARRHQAPHPPHLLAE
jgi:pimeloyl-ACP methyl ester carboxylesterase